MYMINTLMHSDMWKKIANTQSFGIVSNVRKGLNLMKFAKSVELHASEASSY